MSDDPYKLLAEHENGKEKLYRRATDDRLFLVTEHTGGHRTTQHVSESVLDHAKHLVQWVFCSEVAP